MFMRQGQGPKTLGLGIQSTKGMFSQFRKAHLGSCCGLVWFWSEASVLA